MKTHIKPPATNMQVLEQEQRGANTVHPVNAWVEVAGFNSVQDCRIAEFYGPRNIALRAARAFNSFPSLVAMVKQYRQEAIAQGADVSDVQEIDKVLRMAGEAVWVDNEDYENGRRKDTTLADGGPDND